MTGERFGEAEIGALFGRYGDEHVMPVIPRGGLDFDTLVQVAAKVKREPGELLNMTYIDVMEQRFLALVELEAIKLRIFAMENRRADLLATFGECVADAIADDASIT